MKNAMQMLSEKNEINDNEGFFIGSSGRLEEGALATFWMICNL